MSFAYDIQIVSIGRFRYRNGTWNVKHVNRLTHMLHVAYEHTCIRGIDARWMCAYWVSQFHWPLNERTRLPYVPQKWEKKREGWMHLEEITAYLVRKRKLCSSFEYMHTVCLCVSTYMQQYWWSTCFQWICTLQPSHDGWSECGIAVLLIYIAAVHSWVGFVVRIKYTCVSVWFNVLFFLFFLAPCMMKQSVIHFPHM